MRTLMLTTSALAAPFVLSGAYANTLTRLIPDLYAGLDVVSRELVGFIPSVSRDSSAERAAVNEPVVYHIAPAIAGVDIAPAMQIPEPADITVGNDFMVMDKARAFPFGFTGEEQRGLNNGPGYVSVQADLFAQALRGITNEMEADIGAAAAVAASRAYGTAGTAPFASGVGDSAQMAKILDDNGAPLSGRSMVVNTSAGANLRTNLQLTKANEAGTTLTLRQGEILDLNGFSIKQSAGVANFVKGTNAGATTNAAGYAVGATVITLASAGTGTIKAGDVITFAGDTNQYVVLSGDADVSNGGTITLANPGLRVAIPAAATNITTVNSHACNVAFSKDAIHFVTRAPALPQEGDAAVERMMIVDPRSGLAFEVSIYAGYRKMRAEVAAVWGKKVVKSAHLGLLLG